MARTLIILAVFLVLACSCGFPPLLAIIVLCGGAYIAATPQSWPPSFFIFGCLSSVFLTPVAMFAALDPASWTDTAAVIAIVVLVAGTGTACRIAGMLGMGRAQYEQRREEPRRCETCGYSLDYLPEPRCPECGTPFAGEIIVAGALARAADAENVAALSAAFAPGTEKADAELSDVRQ